MLLASGCFPNRTANSNPPKVLLRQRGGFGAGLPETKVLTSLLFFFHLLMNSLLASTPQQPSALNAEKPEARNLKPASTQPFTAQITPVPAAPAVPATDRGSGFLTRDRPESPKFRNLKLQRP